MSERQTRIGLVALLVISALVRIPALTYGFPEIVFRDEVTYAGVALDMLRTGSLDPKEYRYGNFVHYLYYLVFFPLYRTGAWLGIYRSGPGFPEWHFYLLARCLSLVCSLAILLVLFQLGRTVLNARVALLSCLFLSVNPIFFRYSQVCKPDIYVLLFSLLAGLWFWRAFSAGGWRNYLLLGLLAGLGISTKYSMVVIAPCTCIIFWLSRRSRSQPAAVGNPGRVGWGWLASSLALALVLAVVINISVLLNFDEAVTQLQRQYRITVQGKHLLAPILPGLDPWTVATTLLPENMGWPLTVMALGGWVFWLLKHRTSGFIVSTYPLLHYLLVFRWKFAFPREILPVFPVLYLGLSVILDELQFRFSRVVRQGRIPWVSLLVGMVCFGSLIPPIKGIYREQRSLVAGNTKVLAKQWILQNIPADARIARESFALPMRETHPNEVYSYVLGYHPYDYYVQQGVQYLIKARHDPAVLSHQPDVARNDQEIEKRAQLLASWNPAQLGMQGPSLAVFLVPENLTFQAPGEPSEMP